MATYFDLSVESLENGNCRVTVTDSPAGTASTEINAPFKFEELADISDLLAGRLGLSDSQTAEQLQALGAKLFDTFIAGPIKYAYSTSMVRAGGNLQVRLRLDRAGWLAGLPWEKLRDPAGGVVSVTRLDTLPRIAPVGGLQEVLRGPRLLAVIGGVAFCLIATVALFALRPPPPDVDLVITSLRFLPSRPAPGQIFKVTIGIRNEGTTNSGSFDWMWFKAELGNGTAPDLRGTIENLRPGDTITVRGEFSFGWWDKYASTAWINPDGRAPDKNPLNNLSAPSAGQIEASDAPFVIDFSVLPNGEPLQEERDLKGNEFDKWGLKITVDTGGNPACAGAIPRLIVLNNQNALGTALPGKPAQCAGLPLIFTFTDNAFGAAQVDFTPEGVGGAYSLSIEDATGKPIKLASKDLVANVTLAGGAGNTSLIQPLATDGLLTKNAGAVQVRFKGQPGALLRKITFFRPQLAVP
jgi:hypothetical protein